MKNIINFITRIVNKYIFAKKFEYKRYWDKRYSSGGNSGAGSYGEIFEYKNSFLLNFIKENEIKSIIDFGCGDGNQIKKFENIKYLGFDVAKASIRMCSEAYLNDVNKSFILYDPKFFVNNFIQSDLVVCLDVLYHIIDERDFIKTLSDILSCSSKYVVLFTSVDSYKNESYKTGAHVRHRDTMNYLKKFNKFKVVSVEPKVDPKLSSASFIVLEKIS